MTDETTLDGMRTRSVIRLAATTTLAVGAIAFAYASLIERNMFTLRRFDVPILAPDAEPLRVLHVSDLHMMPNQRHKQQWVRELVGTDPDLVIVTGDNMADPDSLLGVARALEPLMDRPGAFVFGSNDYRGPVFKNPLGYFNRDKEYVQGVELPAEELRALFVDAGWSDLNNSRTTIKAGGRAIEIVGVDDPHVGQDDYPSVAGAASETVDLRIGLTHTPEPQVIDAMAADGFELVLAGHTHGGQVRVPMYGALVTNCGLHRSMARGLHRWPSPARSTFLHVSAGLGTHPTAPIRFACPPEATLLTVIPR
jgi:uncharacterized protein